MKFVFCIYNFVDEKLPLQPWLTINEVASRMVSAGHDVHIVTDTHDDSVSPYNLHVIKSLRGSNKAEIYSVIDKIAPDLIVTLVTPLNLATGGWIQRYSTIETVAFSSYPFYSISELIRAIPHVRFTELKSYFRQVLVPGFIWKAKLRKNYSCVICQSDSGKKRLEKLVGSGIDIHSIPPGINLDNWKPQQTSDDKSTALKLLYLGTASDIRGFGVCIKAYASLAGQDVLLNVLARGATVEQVNTISDKLTSMGVRETTELIGGWMDREEMITYISKADLVILPFVLVPSELPVSVMEVIACGTPVVTTDIDGLPSTVGSAGVIVKQGSCSSLVEAIKHIRDNREKLDELKDHCIAKTERMYGWDTMYRLWLETLSINNET